MVTARHMIILLTIMNVFTTTISGTGNSMVIVKQRIMLLTVMDVFIMVAARRRVILLTVMDVLTLSLELVAVWLHPDLRSYC